ncbi:S8 family serine peptidase [Catenulispora sp. GAS73]|uniref:S8 family serine peptidase n=1 Tax=Catenulispora sp. GAS73 TaxID=3156269 RepID=UPI0035191309
MTIASAVSVSVSTVEIAPPALASATTPATDTPVIVLFKDQPASVSQHDVRAAMRTRAIDAIQAPVLRELSQVHAQHLRPFHVLNAVAATVTKAEAARLTANPAVQAVIPDIPIAAPPAASLQQADSVAKANKPALATAGALPPGVCSADGKPMLEPEALADTHTNSDDPAAATARSLGLTGAGVKVGYIADGIDVNNPDFIRSDGSHVIAAYRDFSGEGLNAPTFGAESFLDASAIAAQGSVVHNVQNFGSPALPAPCNIRIEGMSPGAQLYAYKTAGLNTHLTAADSVEAIDYAVNVDHVDVLNESLVVNPVPDSGAMDLYNLANGAAVQAGVTVVASAGDTGPTNTEAVPATNPAVISVGASTTFRWNIQTNYAGGRQFAPGGWVNDNVSPLSAGGFNKAGRTIDLLAPGDESFATCTANPNMYFACSDFLGNPSDVERSSGTSESAPLVAGAAALVIQAYRQAHGGASPTPALVKQLLTSTADDLTAPAQEQGNGLVDSYKAVQAALSVHDANGNPSATGSTILLDQNQLSATAIAGSQQQWKVNVTNNGTSTQTLRLAGRTFGSAQNVQTGSVSLSDAASAHFADWNGIQNNFGTTTFTVPAGTQRLVGSIIYQPAPNAGSAARVRVDLIDPLGRLAAHSLPQAPNGNGTDEVRFPTPGTWTAVIYSHVSTSGGTVGTVPFQASMSNTASFGSVSPAVLTLNPGQSGTVTVTAPTPAEAGDTSGSLVLTSGVGQTAVPILLRSLVNPATGIFHGVLTGGNGFSSNVGQTDTYQFDVPAGKNDLYANVALAGDPNDSVIALLVNPQGLTAAVGSNRLATTYSTASRSGNLQNLTQTDLYARAPQAGRWTLVINFAGSVAGDVFAEAFTGQIAFDKVSVGTTGSMNLGKVSKAAPPVGIAVPFTNTGKAPVDVFLDPRLDTTSTVTLTPLSPAANLPLPLTFDHSAPSWLVPNGTSQVALTAQSTVPATFEYGPQLGDPTLLASSTGTTASGSTSANTLPAGEWAAYPSELGPYPVGGAPTGTASMAMTATLHPIDPGVVPTATNLWQSAFSPGGAMNLVTVQPGQTVILSAGIMPTGTPGTTVNGTVYVDTLMVGSSAAQVAFFSDTADTEPSANELAAIPYTYQIG